MNPNNTDEGPRIDKLRAFWQARPDGGRFSNDPFLGEESNPLAMPADTRDTAAERFPSWSRDRLPGWVASLQAKLLQKALCPGGRQCVYYVHCSGGVDRTGMAMGALMLNMRERDAGMLAADLPFSSIPPPLAEILTWDKEIKEGREITVNTKQGLEWYCFWQVLTQGNLTGDCSKVPY